MRPDFSSDEFSEFLRSGNVPEQFLPVYRQEADDFVSGFKKIPLDKISLNEVEIHIGFRQRMGASMQQLKNVRVVCEAVLTFLNSRKAAAAPEPEAVPIPAPLPTGSSRGASAPSAPAPSSPRVPIPGAARPVAARPPPSATEPAQVTAPPRAARPPQPAPPSAEPPAAPEATWNPEPAGWDPAPAEPDRSPRVSIPAPPPPARQATAPAEPPQRKASLQIAFTRPPPGGSKAATPPAAKPQEYVSATPTPQVLPSAQDIAASTRLRAEAEHEPGSGASGAEARRFRRVPFITEVEVTGVGMRRSSDISIGGMYLETVHQVPDHDQLELRFKLNENDPQPVIVHARVAYHHPGMGVGLTFTAMSEGTRALIQQLVATGD